MDNTITIRISGNAIDISPDGKSALPSPVRAILENKLCYNYTRVLHGQETFTRTGQRRRVVQELKQLYTYDKYERMVCGVGLITKVTKLLHAHGYDVKTVDINPRHARTNRFDVDWDNLCNNFSFLAGQEKCLASIVANDRGIIDASTGFGKSKLFQAICLLYTRANIYIIVKRRDLVESTRSLLLKHIPNVGQVGAGQKKHGRIIVATAASMHNLDADQCDILLADEVHELGAPTYANALTAFKNCRMYGFTATVESRMDNADAKLESLFGPVIFRLSYQEAVDLNLVVPIKVRWLIVNMDKNPADGKVDVPRQRWGIWRNCERNKIIADAAKEYGEDDQVLIMVTKFDHAVHLKQYLPDFTLCYAERKDDAFERHVKSGLLGENEPVMTALRRTQLRRDFEDGKLKKVIATDVWSTGVNFTGLAVLIRADARSSTIMDSQIPGRVCRKYDEGNKTHGLVIDCCDVFDGGFFAASRKRRRSYAQKEWEQTGWLSVNGRSCK